MNKIGSRSNTVREMLDSAKYCCTGGHPQSHTVVLRFAPKPKMPIGRWLQLTEPRQLLWYVVGDEITATMEMWHRMNLLRVEVVFEHRVDPNITLTLSGVPEFVEYAALQELQNEGSLKGESYRISEVLLSGKVGLEHIPGEYVVSRTEFYTASGQEIQNDVRADKRFPSRISVKDPKFRVVPEPNSIDKADVELIDDRLEEKPISAD